MASNAKVTTPNAAAPPPKPVDPNELYPPLKVQGTTFQIQKTGLVISKRGSLFKKAPRPAMITWDSLATCDLTFGCFSGTLTLKQDNGNTISIQGWTHKLREAAIVIYPLMNKGVTTKVREGLQDKLGKRSKVIILGSGLIVQKSTGCCSGVTAFVPWGSVVFAELSRGCFRSSVTVKTMIHVKDLEEKPGKKPVAVSTAARSTAQAPPPAAATTKPIPEKKDEQKGPNYVSVKIPGKTSVMQELFEEVMALMACGAPVRSIEGAPEVMRTTLTSVGVKVEGGIFSALTCFVPWTAVTSVEWTKPLTGKGTVTMTDRVGTRICLKRFGQEEYDALRVIYTTRGVKARGLETGKRPPAIVRKQIRISWEGVSVPHRTFCTYTYDFYPWSIIDAVEMDMTCCGGALSLITEGGVRIPVLRALPFSNASMNETLLRIREMKYHGKAEPDDTNAVSFGAKKGNWRACELTDVALKVVASTGLCSSMTCFLDLDSIQGVQVKTTKGFFSKNYLQISIDKKMGGAMNIDDALAAQNKEKVNAKTQDQILLVRLLKTDNPKAIREDIMRRASARKRAEQILRK